jgi:hypothetical protein
MSPIIQYASFLIRMWHPSIRDTEGVPGEWHSEVEHIQSKRGWTFNTLDELLAFLQQQAEHPEGLSWTETSVESSQS